MGIAGKHGLDWLFIFKEIQPSDPKWHFTQGASKNLPDIRVWWHAKPPNNHTTVIREPISWGHLGSSFPFPAQQCQMHVESSGMRFLCCSSRSFEIPVPPQAILGPAAIMLTRCPDTVVLLGPVSQRWSSVHPWNCKVVSQWHHECPSAGFDKVRSLKGPHVEGSRGQGISSWRFSRWRKDTFFLFWKS